MKVSETSFQLQPCAEKTAIVLWCAGLLFALMPFEAYEAESFMVAVLCVVFASVMAVLSFDAMPRPLQGFLGAPIKVMAVVFWATSFISVLFSAVWPVSFIYFCFFSAFPLSFFLLLPIVKRNVHIILPLLGAVLAFLSLAAIAQFLFFPEMLNSGMASWPFANPNSLAGVLMGGFFCSLGLMLGGSNRLASNVGLLLSALSLCALLTTGSKGAFLSLIAVLPIFLFLMRGFVKKHVRCLSILVVVGAAAFVGFGMLNADVQMISPMLELRDALESELPIMDNRRHIWASTMEIINDHPWVGTGIGTFFLYYPEYRAGDFQTGGFMAHSDPLQFAAEMGVLAVIVFYCFIVFAVWRNFRALRLAGLDTAERVKIAVPFCALGALILHAHITFHFHVLSILMLVGVMLAYWYVHTDTLLRHIPDEYLPEKSSLIVKAGLIAPLLIGAAAFVHLQSAEILVNRANAALVSDGMPAHASLVNRASHISRQHNARAFVAASNVPIGILQLNAPFLPKTEARKLYDQSDELLRSAQALNPRLVSVYFNRAELHAYAAPFLNLKNAQSEEALLEKALQVDPMHIQSRLRLAGLFARRGEKERALGLLVGGLDWPYAKQDPALYFDKTKRLAAELGNEDVQAKADERIAFYDWFRAKSR